MALVKASNYRDPRPFKNGFAPNTANFLNRLIYSPCSIPLLVYVETFVPSFITLLIEQNIPFWDDIARAAGFSMTPPPTRPHRQPRKHIGTTLVPRPEGKAEGRARQGLGLLLRITQPLENIGYIMLLYGTVEKFYYNWSLLLKPFTHCGASPTLGPLTRTDFPEMLSSTGTFLPLFCRTVVQNRANWASTSSQVALPFGKFSVMIEAKFTSNSSIGFNARVGIRTFFAITPSEVLSPVQVRQDPGSLTCTFQTDVIMPLVSGGNVQWGYITSPIPVGVFIEEQIVSIFQYATITGSV